MNREGERQIDRQIEEVKNGGRHIGRDTRERERERKKEKEKEREKKERNRW